MKSINNYVKITFNQSKETKSTNTNLPSLNHKKTSNFKDNYHKTNKKNTVKSKKKNHKAKETKKTKIHKKTSKIMKIMEIVKITGTSTLIKIRINLVK